MRRNAHGKLRLPVTQRFSIGSQRAQVLAQPSLFAKLPRFSETMRRKCQGRLTVHTKSEGFGYLRAHRYAFAFSAGSIRWKPFREPFLFLFAGREVRLPSRGRALLAWGSGDRLVLFFLRLLFLPIASLFASGHVSLLWLTTGYHLRATFRNWPMLDMPMRDSDCPLSTCPPTNSILDFSLISRLHPSLALPECRCPPLHLFDPLRRGVGSGAGFPAFTALRMAISEHQRCARPTPTGGDLRESI